MSTPECDRIYVDLSDEEEGWPFFMDEGIEGEDDEED